MRFGPRSALRRFRQSHRGSMLEETERAFSHMTGGEWPRLDTQAQGTTERLVGMRNEEPVAVSAMSTGTQGQLYLALRIAGHAAFVAEHGPLPFVTDDIHETFDDARAKAAFELAGGDGGAWPDDPVHAPPASRRSGAIGDPIGSDSGPCLGQRQHPDVLSAFVLKTSVAKSGKRPFDTLTAGGVGTEKRSSSARALSVRCRRKATVSQASGKWVRHRAQGRGLRQLQPQRH